jgi:hypothetical protein
MNDPSFLAFLADDHLIASIVQKDVSGPRHGRTTEDHEWL